MTEAEERTVLLNTLTLMGGLAGHDRGCSSELAWEIWLPAGGDGMGALLFKSPKMGISNNNKWDRATYESARDLTRADEFPVPLLRELLNHALGGCL